MGDEFGPIRQLANSRHMTGYKWEKVDRLTLLRLVLICAAILYFLSIGRLVTSAQEGYVAGTLPTRLLECGNLTLMLEEYGVMTWGQCDNDTLYVLGYCDGYQAFDFSATAGEPVKLRYSWYCNPPAFVTKTTCWDFSGTLHLRLIAKDNSTLEEWRCP